MAEQCSRKSNENSDSRPIGDDIEPVGGSRSGVEMGNEEDEEPLGRRSKESNEQRETRT